MSWVNSVLRQFLANGPISVDGKTIAAAAWTLNRSQEPSHQPSNGYQKKMEEEIVCNRW